MQMICSNWKLGLENHISEITRIPLDFRKGDGRGI